MKTLNRKMQVYFGRFSFAFKQSSNSFKGASIVVLSAACYGLSFVLTKKALEFLPPFALLVIGTASSVVFLWIIMLWQGIQIPRQWNIFTIGCIGLLEPGLSYIFIMQGLALTTASNATFINATEPVVTIALAWLILRERINAAKILLTLLACIGLALITYSDVARDVARIGQQTLLGDLLVFLGVVFAALYAIATYSSIRPTKGLAPLQVAVAQQSIALIFFIVTMIGASLLQVEPINFMGITWKSLLLAIATGVLGYGVAFWLYLCALCYQSASENSLYLTLIPVFGVICAYFLLGERLSLLQGFGGALVLMAVISLSWLSGVFVAKQK